MKSLFLWLCMAVVPCFAFSQHTIERSYPVQKGQKVVFKFDYPKLITVSNWDKNEVSVEAIVQVNDGDDKEVFSLLEQTANGELTISNKVDMEKVNEVYYLMKDGIKTKFTSKADLEAYRKEVGNSGVTSVYQQKDFQITIHIKVPSHVSTELNAVYGMVELNQLTSPVTVNAKYGGVDASINGSKVGEIKLVNRYGKIYTDIDLKPTDQTQKLFFTSITAQPGRGPLVDLQSSFGNIYVREAKNP